MKVLLTGASGYVGSVLTRHLVAAGHLVTGLARGAASAARVEANGGTPVRGSLADLDLLRAAASGADAVIHAAIDFADPDLGTTERLALEALLSGLDASRQLVYTSTGLVYPPGGERPAREEDPVDEHTIQPHKIAGERQVLDNGVVPVHVIRAGLVHGHNGPGPVRNFLDTARESGKAVYIGDGANRISAVHVADLADLYVRLLAKRPAERIFNAATAEPVSVRDIAGAVARNTGTAACSITADQARDELEPHNAFALALDSVIDSSRATQVLGWQPTAVSLLADIAEGSYTAD
ncbi:NAD-dependent epimerase/dehydratase family protein [Kutzneria albida]|uniref:NAD-dependent epimerase/dehydratase domain-containing protein n=1 Tax=Kutzneria albida DSM 43870 TaxID=1449976 RepID=W5WCS4_9PSEU|nr:NAD-dependent epimerase/dehydratase family protein [Kutzneria albida]AHH98361.1 hypothetical protein KALB_4999 [Kutzneria albida DSM 43870]